MRAISRENEIHRRRVAYQGSLHAASLHDARVVEVLEDQGDELIVNVQLIQ